MDVLTIKNVIYFFNFFFFLNEIMFPFTTSVSSNEKVNLVGVFRTFKMLLVSRLVHKSMDNPKNKFKIRLHVSSYLIL